MLLLLPGALDDLFVVGFFLPCRENDMMPSVLLAVNVYTVYTSRLVVGRDALVPCRNRHTLNTKLIEVVKDTPCGWILTDPARIHPA